MKDNIINAFIIAALIIGQQAACDYFFEPNPVIEEKVITLTNTDTIYEQLKSLEVISDTIKIFYEKKTSDYMLMPTTERVRLFAERINRQ